MDGEAAQPNQTTEVTQQKKFDIKDAKQQLAEQRDKIQDILNEGLKTEGGEEQQQDAQKLEECISILNKAIDKL